jgi:hypothetical protein
MSRVRGQSLSDRRMRLCSPIYRRQDAHDHHPAIHELRIQRHRLSQRRHGSLRVALGQRHPAQAEVCLRKVYLDELAFLPFQNRVLQRLRRSRARSGVEQRPRRGDPHRAQGVG